MGTFLNHKSLKILLLRLNISHSELCVELGGKYLEKRGTPSYNMLNRFGTKIETTLDILGGISRITERRTGDKFTLMLVRVDKDDVVHLDSFGDNV